MSGSGQHVQVSIVVPVYNSEDCLRELVGRIESALDPAGLSHEIILVNDGSRDKSWDVIRELARENASVRGICFRRNFGQDNALMAGLRLVKGQYAVIMDDDLQHDPDYIPAMYEEVSKGYDVVYASYDQKRQAVWKNLGSWLNDKVSNVVLRKPHELYLSPFKIVRAEILPEVCKYEGPYPYVDGLLLRVTHNCSQVFIEHKKRYAGRSNYTFHRSVRVWVHVATSFSVAPLRISGCIGVVVAFLGGVLAVVLVIARLLNDQWPAGWASLMVGLLLIGGLQLICIGVVGEYVGRNFLNVNRAPQYSIKEILNTSETP